jgi:predicted phage-related endonuclease
MALDDFQRKQRQRYLGSSDAPALAGVDPFGRNQVDVWLDKTGRLEPRRQPRGEMNSPRIVGTYLEPSILSWVEDVLKVRLARDQFKVHANGIMCANFDALALAATPPAVVEAKTAGMFGKPSYFDDFGEPGTDEVPDHVLVQVHHQLAVAETQNDLPQIDLVLVPVLLVSRGFVLYRVPRNQELVESIVQLEEDFWGRYVATNTEPPDLPSLDSVRRILRKPGLTVEVERALVDGWLWAKEGRKLAEEQEEKAAASLLAALGEAESGTCEAGSVTYKQQTRKAYEVPESTFRVLRFSKPKVQREGRAA